MTFTHLTPGMRYPFDFKGEKAKIDPSGFGEFEVPEMPAYIQSYSSRGNAFDGETTPVYQQARFGNRNGRGGMDAYLSQLEDPTYFESYKQKKGNQGVYENERWSPGYDWRGNFGIASLNASKNYELSTRGGMLRKGGPKRSDYIDRPNAWFEKIMPGITNSRYTQNNDNYSGLYEWKRRTPVIQADNDMLVLREMIEHNPFAINSHAAKQAKAIYSAEFGPDMDEAYAAYRDDITPDVNKARFPAVVEDRSPLVRQQQYDKMNLVGDPVAFANNW